MWLHKFLNAQVGTTDIGFPCMNEQEKNKILADLQSGRETLSAILSGVTEEDAAWIPAPGKWSILECVEHVAVSEDYLFSQITVAQHSDTSSSNEQREALIVARGLDRTGPVQSPDVGLPAGRFSTLSDAQRHFLGACLSNHPYFVHDD
jgi:hypothetical protein